MAYTVCCFVGLLVALFHGVLSCCFVGVLAALLHGVYSCCFVGLLVALLHGVHGLDDCGGWHNAYCGKNQGLTEVPADIPPNVWNIFFQDNEISVIETGIFSNYTKCLKLNLDNNKIMELKPGMFDGLESLWELKLSNNGISDHRTWRISASGEPWRSMVEWK